MDFADQELGRIVRTATQAFPSINWDIAACQDENAEHCQWQKDQRCNCDTGSEFYFLDKAGTNQEHGDTSLHRLLALHTPPGALIQYLERIEQHNQLLQTSSFPEDDDDTTRALFQDHPEPPRLDQANNMGVTPLHVAVFRNSWGVEPLVNTLLQQCGDQNDTTTSSTHPRTRRQLLASMPMHCGSYPLHILAGHNMTIRREVLVALLQADPSVVLQDDVNGDNPLSLLWKNVLRFRWALSMEHGTSQHVEYGDQKMSWMTVISPDQYLDFSLLMIRAAIQSQNPSWDATQDDVSLGDICQMPRCPPLLVRLALSGFARGDGKKIVGSAYSVDAYGMLPLHHAVRSKAATKKFLPSRLWTQPLLSVVELILSANPEATMVFDQQGRLPLHYALENNTIDDNDIIRLVQAYPESLRIQDPVTRLYPFQLCAARSSSHQPNNIRTPTSSIVEEAADRSCAEKDRSRKNLSFLFLQLCPEAVLYSGSYLAPSSCH